MLGNYSKHKSSSKKKYPAFIEELCRQFSLEDVRKSTNNFDEERIIGGTEFSIVYKGYLNHNGETDYPIALKGMRNIVFDEWKFKKEIELNCQLRHPNLTSFIGFCDHKDERILVYEYMLNGSVYDHLRLRDNESLSWKKRFEICIGAAKGLHYLHTGAKRAIFHCDIKPQNILLDKSMVPKLSHLGFSIQEKVSKSKPKPVKAEILIFGAFGYTAPECVRTNAFTEKCDVYSFGSFLERFPADEIIDPILMRSIAPRCLEVFVDIMQRCLKYDPNERPTMGEVEVELEHALALHEEADCCR
ncbi:putative receptor-like protein kinase At5g39000 isoform X2 [Vicia villosa]|uniref:putative receptor-like protein kinase At5g39000 isoform X2 n=1 Tax=Vicia villosa TaxID=3911 RepID=UPI00273ABE77|nr:putative receptor-like protein kinase At5g39000 isoform X2 [Vicia villosa]